MKTFADRDAYSGFWDEYLDSTIIVYDTLTAISQVSDTQKLNDIPDMLSGEALLYFPLRVENASR